MSVLILCISHKGYKQKSSVELLGDFPTDLTHF